MDESEVLKFEKPVLQMRLSEAIRIGAKIRPQCDGLPFFDGKSCAMGAAFEGRVGKYLSGYDFAALADGVPELFLIDGNFTMLGKQIAGRNDSGQTREEIADWLETLGY